MQIKYLEVHPCQGIQKQMQGIKYFLNLNGERKKILFSI